MTIPYVPRWTFGEDIAALSELAGTSGTRTANQAASFSCETLAALLVHRFAGVELLVSSRDEYVHLARSIASSRRSSTRGPARVFISYGLSERDAAERIARSLQDVLGRETRVFFDQSLEIGREWFASIREEIEKADAYIPLIGASSDNSKRQQEETELFLRQTLRTDQAKSVIPIVLEGGDKAFTMSRLADYNAVFLDQKTPLETQLAPVISRITRILNS